MKLVLDGNAEILHAATCASPLISVVLPTYNRAVLLGESIESVLNQTERNFELIVVDDGSSDSTGEIIRRCAERDERVTHVRQANLGLPRGLNNGFRIARGSFLTWTSDDNRYLPEAFAVLSGYLRNHETVGFVFAEVLRRRPGGLVHYTNPRIDKFWEYNKFGAAFMYRRTIADRAGEYDPDLAMVEDYEYFLRLSYFTTARHLPYIVYEYREHDESLTSRRRRDQIRAFEKLLKKHRVSGIARRPELSALAATVSGEYRRIGCFADAVRMAWSSWRLWPLNPRSYRSAALALGFWVLRGREPKPTNS